MSGLVEFGPVVLEKILKCVQCTVNILVLLSHRKDRGSQLNKINSMAEIGQLRSRLLNAVIVVFQHVCYYYEKNKA